MIMDIEALQQLYGANMTHNTGDSSYFGASDPGGQDVIDGSHLTTDSIST